MMSNNPGSTPEVEATFTHLRRMLENPKQLEQLEPSNTTARNKKDNMELVARWTDAQGRMVHSPKTLAVKASIYDFIHEEPSVKVIVYTQSITM